MNERSTGNPKSNPMLPWLIVTAVIAVIALVTLFRRADSAPEAPVQADATTAPVAAKPWRSRGNAPASGLPLSPESIRERRMQNQEKRKQVQEQVDRTQAAFASRYANEPVDTAWAGAKESELTKLGVSDQIRQLGVEAENLVVDCKSRMCRITGDFPTMSAGDDWFALYMNNVGEKVPMASYKYVQNPDGTVSINVYAVGRK